MGANFMKKIESDFIVTSEDCNMCANKLLGYAIWKNQIYTSWEEVLLEVDDWSTVQGAYVALYLEQQTLYLHRDSMGLVRLYFFEQNGYWALSNSFWKLCEKVKSRFALTLNMGYAEALMAYSMTPFVPFESLCNEIRVLSAFDEIRINISSQEIEIENDYRLKEKYTLDSEKAFEEIDRWISYWGTLVKAIEQAGYNLEIDLSGGYDSRISYAIAKAANVDFAKKNVLVYSVKPKETGAKNHFSGDYEIAEKIAREHNVELVASTEQFGEVEICAKDRYDIYEETLSDCMNEVFDRGTFYEDPLIKWGGYLGETTRGFETNYWKNGLIHRCCINNGAFQEVIPMKRALKTVLKSYNYVQQVTGNNQKDSKENALQYCIECLDGAFFGKQIQQYLRMNVFCVSPFMDVVLRMIQVESGMRPEILLAVILARTCPELLEIPYSSEAGFTKEEIEYAKQLNDKYENKIQIEIKTKLERRDIGFEKIPYELATLDDSIRSIIVDRFDTEETQIILERKFGTLGTEMYRLASRRLERPVFQNETYAAAICSMMRMIKVEETSTVYRNRDVQAYLAEPTWEELFELCSGYSAIDDLYQSTSESTRMQEYIESAKRDMEKEVYLYGAGEYAREMAEIFSRNGVDIAGFIVTKLSDGVTVMGKPVVGKDEFCYEKDRMIIFPAVSMIYLEDVKASIAEIENA